VHVPIDGQGGQRIEGLVQAVARVPGQVHGIAFDVEAFARGVAVPFSADPGCIRITISVSDQDGGGGVGADADAEADGGGATQLGEHVTWGFFVYDHRDRSLASPHQWATLRSTWTNVIDGVTFSTERWVSAATPAAAATLQRLHTETKKVSKTTIDQMAATATSQWDRFYAAMGEEEDEEIEWKLHGPGLTTLYPLRGEPRHRTVSTRVEIQTTYSVLLVHYVRVSDQHLQSALADSFDECSKTGSQGSFGWTNGYYDPGADTYLPYHPSAFRSTWSFSSAALDGDGQWSYGSGASLSTRSREFATLRGSPKARWPIRRWTSDYTGKVALVWELRNADAECGTAATGILYRNGLAVDSATLPAASATAISRTVCISVVAGDRLDLAVRPIGDAGSAPATACNAVASRLTVLSRETAVTIDRDADGVEDWRDNCPTVLKPAQADSAGDRIGGACDPTPIVAAIVGPAGEADGAEGGQPADAADGAEARRAAAGGGGGGFDACGGVLSWNLLGPYRQPLSQTADNPGDHNIRRDYMTDGTATENDFLWFPGATIDIDYGPAGAAWKSGLVHTGQPDLNPGGVPTVLAWFDDDGFINLNDDVYANNPDVCMSYAQIYAYNTTGADLDLRLGVSSDDSVQVIVNGQEVWIHSIARPGSDACASQDVVPAVLQAGENSIIVKVFDGFVGFNFALAITDPSGMPITAGLELSLLPAGGCHVPPVKVNRQIDGLDVVEIQHDAAVAWRQDETYPVALFLSRIRQDGASPDCARAGPLTIAETVPAGWVPAAPSHGGSIDGRTIVWENVILRDEDDCVEGPQVLHYQVTAGGPLDEARFRSTVEERDSPVTCAVGGVGELDAGDFSDQGFFRKWLHLGPYQQPFGAGFGAAPSASNIEADWLTDGVATQLDIHPSPGDTIDTDHAGSALAAGLAPALGPFHGGVNPDGVPTWLAWTDRDDTIDCEDYYGGNLERVMTHSFTYVAVERDMTVDIGVASDDSVEVILDGVSIHTNGIPRPFGAANAVQDVIPGIRLAAGVHTLLVKVFEGGGEHGFRLRFQDELGNPITDGVRLCFYGCSTCNGRVLAEVGEIAPGPVAQRVSGSVTAARGNAYTFAVATRACHVFTMCSDGGISDYDPWLFLLDSGGMALAENDDTCGLQSRIDTELSPGLYTTAVSGFGASAGSYALAFFSDVENACGPPEDCRNGSDDDGDDLADCDDDCAGEPACLGAMFLRGDADSNSDIDLRDAVGILAFLFLGGRQSACWDAADADDSGNLDLSEAIGILNFLFLGGAAPSADSPCRRRFWRSL
jgi:hypothetical protein